MSNDTQKRAPYWLNPHLLVEHQYEDKGLLDPPRRTRRLERGNFVLTRHFTRWGFNNAIENGEEETTHAP